MNIQKEIECELDNLTLLEQRNFLHQVKGVINLPQNEEEMCEYIDLMNYIRAKIEKIERLFIFNKN